MALHALEFGRVKAMNEKQRFDYFCKYAGRIEDSPKLCYAIRIGSKTLMSDDTYDLRMKMEEHLGPRVPYKMPAMQFLRQHGWERSWSWHGGGARLRNTMWWKKVGNDDKKAVSQTAAVKQQMAENRRTRKVAA
jgi:hypothetical protein